MRNRKAQRRPGARALTAGASALSRPQKSATTSAAGTGGNTRRSVSMGYLWWWLIWEGGGGVGRVKSGARVRGRRGHTKGLEGSSGPRARSAAPPAWTGTPPPPTALKRQASRSPAPPTHAA
jgi:hypothetical protein